MEQYTMSENICPQIFYKQIKKSCKSYSKKKKEMVFWSQQQNLGDIMPERQKGRKTMSLNTKAYEKMNYGLYLVSASAEGKRQGCIVSSFAQVTSSRPARFTVTINKDNETCKAVAAAGSFAVTMLAADCPKELVNQFGYKSGRVAASLTAMRFLPTRPATPILRSTWWPGCPAGWWTAWRFGSYILFVGQATEAEVLADGSMLTLEEFTTGGKQATPPAATVYRSVEINGYRCTICGYVHEAESLPADFICPICRATADKFEKIEK